MSTGQSKPVMRKTLNVNAKPFVPAAPAGVKKAGTAKRKDRRTRQARSAALSASTGLRNGTHGINIRSNLSQPKTDLALSEQSPGSLNTVAVFVNVTQRSIAYLSMGILLKALKCGVGAAQAFQETPYFMFRYLIDVFTTCMQSGTMKLTAAPHWMWELLYALKPKEARFKTGNVNYSWRIVDSPAGTDQQFILGNGEDNYAIFWGTGAPTGTPSVNGFPVLGPTTPAYTEELGLAAIAKMWPYVMQSGEKLMGDPGPEGVTTSRDTSAFAVVYPELGESYDSSGGVRTTVYSERHIDSPILSQFGTYQPGGSPYWRGWHEARVGAGTPCMIGPQMIDSRGQHHRNKNVPILKYYNFDEFWEQLCLTMCYAQEKRIEAGESAVPCPLNWFQVAVLLRQTMLQVANNEVAQDVRYSGASFINLLPFTVGPNGTLGGGSVVMCLPTFLAENIRAIGSIETDVSKKFNSTVTWYPILARPPSKELPIKFVYGDGQPLFADPAGVLPVNLIDLSVQENQNTLYLDVTRIEIQAIAKTWNNWIGSMSSTLSPLVTVSSEKGIRAINCNTYSNLQEQIEVGGALTTAGLLQKRKSIKKGIGCVGISERATETVKVDGSSYMQYVGDRRITSLSGFSRPLEQIMETFILPVNLSENALEDASYQGYQAFMIEPSTRSRTSLGGFGGASLGPASLPTAWDRHGKGAAIDVKAFGTAGQNNEIIAAFTELSRQGRGGFLSSALSGLVNAILPGSGGFVKQVLEF